MILHAECESTRPKVFDWNYSSFACPHNHWNEVVSMSETPYSVTYHIATRIVIVFVTNWTQVTKSLKTNLLISFLSRNIHDHIIWWMNTSVLCCLCTTDWKKEVCIGVSLNMPTNSRTSKSCWFYITACRTMNFNCPDPTVVSCETSWAITICKDAKVSFFKA